LIDGASTDSTMQIVEKYKSSLHHVVSEPDKGLYDAINKGIALATGTVIGLLNADDILADQNVLQGIADEFVQNEGIDGVYGDLNYIHPKSENIIRLWKSKQSSKKDIELGWMPAHPTIYLRKHLFEKFGGYALDMGTAADYDLILRYFHSQEIRTTYLPYLFVKMRMGGLSNRSFLSLASAMKHDYKALKRNNIPNPLFVLLKKKLLKLSQFSWFDSK
jgi:glycosyltransferase involved in cell wall biosynthesis